MQPNVRGAPGHRAPRARRPAAGSPLPPCAPPFPLLSEHVCVMLTPETLQEASGTTVRVKQW